MCDVRRQDWIPWEFSGHSVFSASEGATHRIGDEVELAVLDIPEYPDCRE